MWMRGLPRGWDKWERKQLGAYFKTWDEKWGPTSWPLREPATKSENRRHPHLCTQHNQHWAQYNRAAVWNVANLTSECPPKADRSQGKKGADISFTSLLPSQVAYISQSLTELPTYESASTAWTRRLTYIWPKPCLLLLHRVALPHPCLLLIFPASAYFWEFVSYLSYSHCHFCLFLNKPAELAPPHQLSTVAASIQCNILLDGVKSEFKVHYRRKCIVSYLLVRYSDNAAPQRGGF